jgi:hypothetical protein
MATDGTVLKALLRERHLQEHQAFCREYDRVARRVDPGLQHSYPSKATFYRWHPVVFVSSPTRVTAVSSKRCCLAGQWRSCSARDFAARC